MARCRLDMGGTIPRPGDPRQRYVYVDSANPPVGLARRALPIALPPACFDDVPSLTEGVTYGAMRHLGENQVVAQIRIDLGAFADGRFFSREKDPHGALREPHALS